MAPKTREQFATIRAESRKKIMEVALELYSQKGYDATSMSQIAQKAEISKGLIYNYFDSKKALVLAILEDAMSAGSELAEGMQKAETPQEKVRFIIESAFKWITEHEAFSKTLMQLSLQVGKWPEIQNMVDQKIEGWRVHYVHLFEELGFDNPEMESYCMGALMDGIALQYLSVGDKIGIEKLEKFLLDKYCKQTSKNP